MARVRAIKRRFWRRRLRNTAVLVLLWIALLATVHQIDRQLLHVGWWTGLMLYTLILLLMAFGVRKRLPGLPLGRVSIWMQAHIYMGLASIGVFGMHIKWHVPNGMLETLLAMLYVATAVSGLWGLYVTRTAPRRLTRLADQILTPHIEVLRQEVAQRAQQLVLQTVTASGQPTLAEFYQHRLLPYFEGPPGWSYRLWPGARRRRQLMFQLRQHQRYMSQRERAASEQIFHLMRRKDDLDYQSTLQGHLRLWSTLHIALSCALTVLGLLHGVLAWRFLGV